MTYLEHIDYLKQLGAAHKDIRSVIVGDYQDIIDKERSSIDYPCLWIESPESQFVGDNDSFEEVKSGSFVVLQNGDPKDEAKRQYNLEQTYRIARSVALRLLRDYGYMRFEIKNRRLVMIDSIYNDADQGWRFSFDQHSVLSDSTCYDATEWDETVRPTDMLRFTLVISGTTAVATVNNMPAGYTPQWKLRLNNQVTATASYSSTETFNITSGDNVFVELYAVNGSGHVRTASVFGQEAGTYKSVPFTYNKYR